MFRRKAFGGYAASCAIALATLACNLEFAPANLIDATTTPSATAMVASATSGTLPSNTLETPLAPSATNTATATMGPPPLVTVSAAGGRLNIRRGPGPEYDYTGVLREGESTTATARSATSTWLYVNAPNTSKPLGWVIITTQYTSVSGPTAGLPVLTVGPAVPAYIRNCTEHEMVVNPNGAVLLERGSVPENQLQFFPGEYTVIDTTTETEVASVTILEGRTVDIKKDGLGSSYSCP